VSQQPLDSVFQEWHDNQAIAEQMIPMIGSLYRHNNVVVTMYGRSLFNRSVIRILKDHRYVRKVEGTELSVQDTFPLVKAMTELNLGPAHVDVGKLGVAFKARGGDPEMIRREGAQMGSPQPDKLSAGVRQGLLEQGGR